VAEECVDACPTGALSRDEKVVLLDTQKMADGDDVSAGSEP